MSQVMGYSLQQQRQLEAKSRRLERAEALNEKERRHKKEQITGVSSLSCTREITKEAKSQIQSTNDLAQSVSMSRQKKTKGKKSVDTYGIKTYYRDVAGLITSDRRIEEDCVKQQKEKTRSLSLNRQAYTNRVNGRHQRSKHFAQNSAAASRNQLLGHTQEILAFGTENMGSLQNAD